ncbi:MAG: type II secretion system F family protein [Pseudomonadota bacterium]
MDINIIIGAAIIGALAIWGFSVYQKKKLRIKQRHTMRNNIIEKYSEDAGEDEVLPKQNLLSTIASHKYAQRYLRYIDFDSNSIVNMSALRSRALKAGIRDAREHRVLAAGMIILPILAAPVGFILPNFLMKEVTLNMQLIGMLSMAIIGFLYTGMRIDGIAQKRQEEFAANFPDMLDLMIVCLEAGMSAEQAFVKMAEEFQEGAPVLAEEISILSAELTYFLDGTIAYENLQRRVDHGNVRAFSSALIQSKKFGTPLAQSLKALSHEIRVAQMAEIERKAASLPAKLTVPMMLFTLPVLLTVIMSPAVLELIKMFSEK